ncbi:MAG: glycosyltransferase family 2 protein [Candidatus Hydrothermales bacterium]
MGKITGVIIALNAEETIERAIDSLFFCDEIIVIDGGSTDKTLEIVRKKKAIVFERKFDNFKNQREFALSKVKTDWVIFLDSDEQVEKTLAEEILKEIKKNTEDGFYLMRASYFLGKLIRFGGWYPDYSLRVFRKEKARISESIVHEKILVEGKVKKIKRGKIIHYTDPDLFHYINKLNLYTELSARELFSKGKRASILDLIFRPLYFFLRMYIIRLGFLDGFHGFILAICSSFHTFIKYAKLWNLSHKLKHN